ncbi:diguanylate cyclase [Gandjariella thermophila]|uniref:Diguanylate cyclase n=1 Tax=Gandjariella thermophila TaxID=1931992 RepID=A0A4D4J323_9PSEU|nr:diguanylate cyclase [Gandjariella thermophila]
MRVPGPVGEPARGEPSDLTEASDDWLLSRSRELVRAAQFGPLEQQVDAAAEMLDLLAEARRRGPNPTFLTLLSSTVSTFVASAGTGHRADGLLEELLRHARQRGLWLHEAAGRAYLARQALFAGREDDALTHAATAMAILDAGGEPYPGFTPDAWLRTLISTLNAIGLVLAQLGLFEQADEFVARAARLDRDVGQPGGAVILLINRVRVLLGWALHLERAGRHAEGAEKFAAAAATTGAIEAPWSQFEHPGRDRPPAEVDPMVGAAHALADPHPGHRDRLYRLLDGALYAREQIVVAIALARCWMSENRPDEAARVLRRVSRRLVGNASEPALALSLAHELATVSQAGQSRRDYADALEAELWALHEARVATVRARVEHARLDRRHRDAARLARQDPLTRLPNRRALAEAIAATGAEPGWTPAAVALVDLDGFKRVNDGGSHARGDEVLRAVAATLREAMRADDLVARYGGDEFVVLLRRTAPAAARAAMRRAVRAVAALPLAREHGITASVGLTRLRAEDSVEAALRRADAAMYLAKRGGGNQVRMAGD